ncbi:MAG: hypothetical protein ACP5T3_01035 [Candidatus Micrarchaeia archaeon]
MEATKEAKANTFSAVTNVTKLGEAIAFFDKFLNDSNLPELKSYLLDAQKREQVNASWVFVYHAAVAYGSTEQADKAKEINGRIPGLADKLGLISKQYEGKAVSSMPPRDALATIKSEFAKAAGTDPSQFKLLDQIEALIAGGLLDELEKRYLAKMAKREVQSGGNSGNNEMVPPAVLQDRNAKKEEVNKTAGQAEKANEKTEENKAKESKQKKRSKPSFWNQISEIGKASVMFGIGVSSVAAIMAVPLIMAEGAAGIVADIGLWALGLAPIAVGLNQSKDK